MRLFIVLMLVTTGAMAGPQIPAEPEGNVRMYNVANSAFDQYTESPTDINKAWMRANYVRMQVYSTYFDSRLSWYPEGWVYKDSYAIKPDWPIASQHPEYILRDSANNKLYIQWGCTGGTCPQFAADIGNPGFRTWWINEAKALVAKGYKGIWVDDVNLSWRIGNGNSEFVQPIDPRTHTEMTINQWQTYFAVFLEQIKTALPTITIAHNSIWYADEFADPEIQRQIAATDYINLERGANDQGLTGGTGQFSFLHWLDFIDMVHSKGKSVILMDYNGGSNTSLVNREFGLAAYLLINNGKDMISSNQLQWVAPGKLWAKYSYDLGLAKGKRYTYQGVLRRDFKCGYVLLNIPGSSTLTVLGVTLAPRTAIVTRTGCPKPPTLKQPTVTE